MDRRGNVIKMLTFTFQQIFPSRKYILTTCIVEHSVASLNSTAASLSRGSAALNISEAPQINKIRRSKEA